MTKYKIVKQDGVYYLEQVKDKKVLRLTKPYKTIELARIAKYEKVTDLKIGDRKNKASNKRRNKNKQARKSRKGN